MRVDSGPPSRLMNHRSRLLEAQRRHPSMRGWDGGRGRRRRRRRQMTWRRAGAIVVVGGTVGATVAVVVGDGVDVRVRGIADGAVLDQSAVDELTIELDVSGIGAGDATVSVNGAPVDVEQVDGSSVVRPGPVVRNGTNELEVRVPGGFPFGDEVVTHQFEAVLGRPRLAVATQVLRPVDGEPVEIRGLVDDAVGLDVDEQPVAFDGGAFSVTVSAAADRAVVRARHANGNTVEQVVTLVDEVSVADRPETRAVHISARGWADPELRAAVLALAADGRINAVQLDVKDESGEVGYLSAVELAQEAGSARPHYEPAAALDELHSLDVRVIARIVCFLDPVVAEWAWSEGQTDLVVQDVGGGAPLDSDYGDAAFTSFASPAIQQYLIDLSVEAAEAGFDEILYDYVRRPEGAVAAMHVPGLERSPEVEIARFVRDTAVALEPFDVDLGVSVFGIAASRPHEIAQDIRLLAPHVDYVAPMVYPSHWGPGEYGVADPLRQPGEIVARSLEDFRTEMGGSGAAIVPWLQAFDAGGVVYGPAQVQAQVAAASEAGSAGFLLWNAGSVYDAASVGAPG